MTNTLILWPVLVQISLTFCMFILLAVRKESAVNDGAVDRVQAALHNDAWPDEVLQVSNNIQNQFQTPVIFYVLVVCFGSTGTGVSNLIRKYE